MRFLFNLLTMLAALLALFIVGMTVGGIVGGSFAGSEGIALLAFQAYGAITSLASLILGVLGMIFLSTKPKRVAIFASSVGALGLAVLGAMVMLG
ncbi:MAG: hypothetical protein AAFW83_11450 [Pseudomonadota bacterium]